MQISMQFENKSDKKHFHDHKKSLLKADTILQQKKQNVNEFPNNYHIYTLDYVDAKMKFMEFKTIKLSSKAFEIPLTLKTWQQLINGC